ncbi:MAG: SOUL family heme-binding protein [Pseudobdellovibrio sp.]
MKKLFISIISLFSLTGCSLFGIRNEETPQYEILVKNKNLEIRQYAPFIVATTYVDGSFEESQKKSFRILANYIFGDNEKKVNISMTSPVVISSEKNKSVKIAMTAPVTQNPVGPGWEMSFMMPSKFKNIEDLPQPKDSRISFKVIESKSIAVITFSGFWSKEKNQKMADQLKTWILEQGEYTPISEPKFAGYDPPWTIPLFRRNEMMIDIIKR